MNRSEHWRWMLSAGAVVTSFGVAFGTFAAASGVGSLLDTNPRPVDKKPAEKEAAKPVVVPEKLAPKGEKVDSKPDEIYAPLPVSEARARSLEWVATRGVTDPKQLERVANLWKDAGPGLSAREVLEKVIETFATIDPATRKFVDDCRLGHVSLLAPKSDLLNDKRVGDFYSNHMRLFFGRYLTQRRMYDEGLEMLGALDPKQVVDPATCLFFRAICEQQLMKSEEGLRTLNKLLKNTQEVPPSYAAVATLMQDELSKLKPKTLDSVARKMLDSERRLDLARAGERVQKVQGEIVADLDEIIKKMEEEGGGGGGDGDGSGSSKSNQSSNAAKDSSVKGATAPGDVDKKNERKRSPGWGNLPPKERTEVMNILNRNFPANYRRATEAYTRKLSTRVAPPSQGK